MLAKLSSLLRDRPDLLFFGAYLFALPFSWRKVIALYPPPGYAGFGEYWDVSIAIGDILLLITIFLYILNNKDEIKSIIRKMFHVEHYWIFLPVLFSAYSFLSYFWSDQKMLSLFQSIKIFEYLLLFYYIVALVNVPRGTLNKSDYKCSTWNIQRFIIKIVIFTALFQSILAIFQFILQKSLHLRFLQESIVSAQLSGVAKIIYNGDIYIRAYGTFLHPNILGGFLGISILLILYIWKKKMFHVEQFVLIAILVVISAAFILTFSKSAFLALIVSLIFFIFITHPKNKMFHVEHFILFIPLIALLFTLTIQEPRYSFQSFKERLNPLSFSINSFQEHPILGIGSGQYVYKLSSFDNFQQWELQPIHNIYILILNEYGILGLIMLLIFIVPMIKNVPRGTSGYLLISLVIYLLVIGCFDHYLYDIEFGKVMITVIFALTTGKILTKQTI